MKAVSIFLSVIVFSTQCAQFAFSSCSLHREGESNGDSTELVVSDYAGRPVSLLKPARRIVALAPHIVENLFAAGSGDLLVGAVAYADYPEAAKEIPRVGGVQGLSAEAIVALNPDLIIAWPAGHSPRLLQRLSELGLPIYFDEPKKLEDIARSINAIGALSGREHKSAPVARQYLQQLSALRQKYAAADVVRVFYQVWHDPLQTINGEHMISDVIKLCGGQNIFQNAVPVAPTVNIESLIDSDPDAIIVSVSDQQGSSHLDDWQKWDTLTAVKHQRLFRIHPDLLQRPTVRLLHGAEILCRQLHSVRREKYERLW